MPRPEDRVSMAAPTLTPVLQFVRRLGGRAGDDDDGELLRRFTRGGDAAAFEALVRRHGPMVLGVCRRVLRDEHAVEDAFQATFLLLVRKARGLRRPGRVGPWLHGVAHRTALAARSRALRRREQPVTAEPPDPAMPEPIADDLRPALDAAIDRLPARERTAVVLCYLEGLTYADAARRLGCPLGTLAARVSRGRDRLRARLMRQGLAPVAALVAAGTAAESPALPPALIASTVRAAAALASGAADGAVSASVLTLMTGVHRTMLLHTYKTALAVLTVLGLAGAGTGWLVHAHTADPTPPAGPNTPVPPPAVAAPDKPADGERMVPLAALRQKPSDVYRIAAGDVLGLYVEGVFGSRDQPPPVYLDRNPVPGQPLHPPALGYPVAVTDDGSVSLPLIESLHLTGKSTREVEMSIRNAYIGRGVLVQGRDRVMVSLIMQRSYRVTIVRYDLPGPTGASRHGTGATLNLPAYENDVLNALAKSGGLPGPDSNATVVIQRPRGAGASAGTTELTEIRIPLRFNPSKPVPFKPDDVILQNGDIVIVEGRDAAPEADAKPVTGPTPPAMTLAVAMPDGGVLVQLPGGGWQTVPAARVQASETDGRPIAAADLAGRLKAMTAVLVVADGQAPEAAHLQAVKAGTPVLVIRAAAGR